MEKILLKKGILSVFMVFCVITVISCMIQDAFTLDLTKTYVLSLNSVNNVVDIIDTGTQQLLSQTIAVANPENNDPTPNDIIDGNNGFYYIINSRANAVDVFNKEMRLVREVKLEPGSNPYNGCADESFLYVSNLESGKIARINLVTYKVDYSVVLDSGIQEVCVFDSTTLIVLDVNYDAENGGFDPTTLYFVDKSTLQKKGAEAVLNLSMQGGTNELTNFQQAKVHDSSGSLTYVDLYASGCSWIENAETIVDSGILRISVDARTLPGSYTVAVVSKIEFPAAENIGPIVSVYDDGGTLYSFFTSNTALYQNKLETTALAIKKNTLSSLPLTIAVSNLSAIALKLVDGVMHFVFLDVPWGDCSILYVQLTGTEIGDCISNFDTLSLANVKQFKISGYPVDILVKEKQ